MCPRCSHEFDPKLGGKKGGLSLPSVNLSPEKINEEKRETPKSPVRGKAREYSQAFEIAWKSYGRKDQKFEAFGVWLLRSKELGGEPQLLTLFLAAIKWQGPLWSIEGWRFAPYFERYLKRRKWEDEPPPLPVRAATAPDDRGVRATDAKIAALRATKPLTQEEQADLAKLRASRG